MCSCVSAYLVDSVSLELLVCLFLDLSVSLQNSDVLRFVEFTIKSEVRVHVATLSISDTTSLECIVSVATCMRTFYHTVPSSCSHILYATQ